MSTVTEGDLKRLEDVINKGFSELDRKIDGLDRKIDDKVDALEKKLDGKIDALEKKLDGKIDALEKKLDVYMAKTGEQLKGIEKRFDDNNARLGSIDKIVFSQNP
jgi:chromosome segregation ATPase